MRRQADASLLPCGAVRPPVHLSLFLVCASLLPFMNKVRDGAPAPCQFTMPFGGQGLLCIHAQPRMSESAEDQ